MDRGALVLGVPRRFGRFVHVEDVSGFVAIKGLGLDALDIVRDEFIRRLSGRKGAVKTVLLDQRVVAAIGRLYADEILFQEELAPFGPRDGIPEEESS